MHSTSAVYVVQGLVIVGSLAFLFSLAGLPVLFLLRRAHDLTREHGRVKLIDMLCLLTIAGPLSAFIWHLFPEGDKLDGGVYLAVFLLMVGFWWWCVVASLTRSGIVRPIRRAVYQIIVIPLSGGG